PVTGLMEATASNSIDLAQAYKVFNTIPFIATVRYWAELVRVVKPGGFCVFDAMTERCLDPETLSKWIKSSVNYGSYPAAMPRIAVIEFFQSRGFTLKSSFAVPNPPGCIEAFVFQKQ